VQPDKVECLGSPCLDQSVNTVAFDGCVHCDKRLNCQKLCWKSSGWCCEVGWIYGLDVVNNLNDPWVEIHYALVAALAQVCQVECSGSGGFCSAVSLQKSFEKFFPDVLVDVAATEGLELCQCFSSQGIVDRRHSLCIVPSSRIFCSPDALDPLFGCKLVFAPKEQRQLTKLHLSLIFKLLFHFDCLYTFYLYLTESFYFNCLHECYNNCSSTRDSRTKI
jgi:hypothetical protein